MGAPEETKLKRALGLGYATLFGVGLILGAGIYALVGRAAEFAGDAIWLSVSFAALIAILTSLSFAEFASIFPTAASTHTYVRETFPKLEWLAFISGWLLAFGGIAGAVTAATGFSKYFTDILDIDKIWIPTIALVLVLLLTIVNYWGIEESSKLIAIFTAIELFGLLFVSFLGLAFAQRSPAYLTISASGSVSGLSLLLLGAAVFYFAFTGFELQPTLAEEVKEPRKNVPRAIIIALLVCSFVYVLVAASVVRLLPPEELAKSGAPLADAASRVWSGAYMMLGVIALFATSNTVLGFLVSGSRLIYGLAEEGFLPEKIKLVHEKRRTPYIAIAIAAIIAILLLAMTEYLPSLTGWKVIAAGGIEYELIDLLSKTSSLACLIVFIIINLSVVWLRFKRPELERMFKVPSIALPILGAVLTAVFIFTSFLDWIIWLNTFVVALIGFILYRFGKRKLE
ncbi:MAG: APC family permease [Candidatus Korarchaeota archaeon]|nr:APC family permease [Thermoproteota archaeon]MCR8501539.1 APC family permease [Thermoproteota archaeon]